MNTKVIKIAQIVAATMFLAALVVNISVTLNDPFIMMSDEAVATGTSGTDDTVPGTGGSGSCASARSLGNNIDYGACMNSSHEHITNPYYFPKKIGEVNYCSGPGTTGNCIVTGTYVLKNCQGESIGAGLINEAVLCSALGN